MISAHTFANLFFALVILHLAVKATLMLRQMRHVHARRGAVPPPFADAISLSAHQKAADYTCARMRLNLAATFVSAVFVLVLTLGGGLQHLYAAWSGVLAEGGLAHGIALLASLGVLNWLLDLPFVVVRTFGIERRFGFNRMTVGLFVADAAKEAVIATLIGIPLLAAVLWLMGAMGQTWWLWVWGVWLGFNLLAMLIWPTFIAPLFNKFSPLTDETLKRRVEALLARCGFQARGLYVMDGSRRSAHGNAYFTGFGAAKRIVFFDTLLDKLNADEIEAVLAHELGHFRRRHVWKRIGLLAALTLAMLWLLSWLMQQEWFYAGLGMQQGGTAVALALVALALPAFSFPLVPLMSHWSRVHEFQADAYAASQAQPQHLVSALVKLYRDNASTLTPDPLYSRVFDSHPSAALRIARLQYQTSEGMS